MYWKIGDFDFDEDKKILSRNSSTELLEPKTAALLSYFIRHPQQDISRETLLEFVWNGQVVTDGAINRVVLKLRKALNDEAKVKSYIVTVPKVGYRFIAQTNEITQAQENVSVSTVSSETKKSKSSFLYLAVALLLFTFVMLLRQFDSSPAKEVSQNQLISPVTRLSERQYDAVLSNDNSLLAYSTSKSDGTAIFVVDPNKHNPFRVSMLGGWSQSAHWVEDDSALIYLYRNNDRCEFHRVPFIDDKPQQAEVIYQCTGNSITQFAYAKKNNKLYFVERQTPYSSYAAFELDLENGGKRLMSQPLSRGRGNHFIHRHSATGKLLLLGDVQPGKTTAYELDAEKNSFTPLIEFGYGVSSAVWAHQLDGLIHPGQHPSYQLVKSYFDETKKSRVLVSDSNRISQVEAVANGKDYLFTSYMSNRDIFLQGEVVSSLNSSVMDYLPTQSLKTGKLAFISKRSGYSKIWVANVKGETLNSIEPPDKGRTFYDLQWSFNDELLLANTDSGIIVFDTNTLAVSKVFTPELPAYGVSWITNTQIAFSVFNENQWQLYHANIETGVIKPQDNRWAFMLASEDAQLYIDQQLDFFTDGTHPVVIANCPLNIRRHVLNLRMDGKNLTCLNNKGKLTQRNLIDGKTATSEIPMVRRFDIANGSVAYSRVVSSTSDIIRTNTN